ncbi:hypothetical protein BDV25DRAFT_157794 [Aspergillus avenaceus]|uniref:Zn(2)-C6 fungal-type domain-containing protein n=1 Tax=Aspergillus avenaceus TaxID=36643 RepID=A0A5N6TQV6_ASPAV|nr:hypothetical protein BDV25DRAFT_157794 [Aspergillus avenaceus]
MSPRLAACEVCRKAKLACDHKQPVCTRCKSTNREGLCVYRASPFKRRRISTVSPSLVEQQSTFLRSPDPSPLLPRPRQNAYPNPGYMGFSSHVAIFNHISPDDDDNDIDAVNASHVTQCALRPMTDDDDDLMQRGAETLRQFIGTFPLDAMINLVKFWLAKGVNLAMAEPFVEQCVQTMKHLLTFLSQEGWHLAYAERLLRNSARPLEFDQETTLASFTAQFVHQNARWETLGIFFSAVSRAALDVAFFPSLYSTENEQYALRKMAMKASDQALEISLSLDCLNDVKLIQQYENFIVHTHVDGDQSFHTWRRLGDMITSTFALGYHENIKNKPNMPPFLVELRKLASARIYSSDKNVAIFLGRPPRMSKRFCHFQLSSSWTGFDSEAPEHIRDTLGGCGDAKASYHAETRWSALCASLKEEIMEMFCDGRRDTYVQRASVIQNKAEAYWDALPPHFRLEGSLKQSALNPFEKDFVAGVRLNHLHVLFLLRLLLLNTPAEPDTSIVEVAQQILSLVVEMILLRDQLVNSGTALVWKVAYYGLPAAGIILLAMLRRQNITFPAQRAWTKPVQDLTVFVAEIEAGAIVRHGDPNYALLSKAAQTIRRFLDSIHCEVAPQPESDNWASFLSQELWDFEFAFWENLADHPSLDSLSSL